MSSLTTTLTLLVYRKSTPRAIMSLSMVNWVLLGRMVKGVMRESSSPRHARVTWEVMKCTKSMDVQRSINPIGMSPWRRSNNRFELLEKKLIVFTQSALKREDFKKTEDVFNRVMNRDNIAVACHLRHKQDGYRVIVANAHIHWDPAFSDVKLVQVAMLMEELDDLATKW